MSVRRSRKRLARPVPQRFAFDELAMLPPPPRHEPHGFLLGNRSTRRITGAIVTAADGPQLLLRVHLAHLAQRGS